MCFSVAFPFHDVPTGFFGFVCLFSTFFPVFYLSTMSCVLDCCEIWLRSVLNAWRREEFRYLVTDPNKVTVVTASFWL